MALNRSDKSRILRRYFSGMTRNSEMSTEPSAPSPQGGADARREIPAGRSSATPAGLPRRFVQNSSIL